MHFLLVAKKKKEHHIDQTKLRLCSFPTMSCHQPRSWIVLAALKSSNEPVPRPGDVVNGVQVAADSWLASLATGESDDAATTAAVSLALQAALAAAVMSLLMVSR
jgi:hypothetical protein